MTLTISKQTLGVTLGLGAFAASGLANVVADLLPPAGMRALNLAGVAAGLLGFGAVHAVTAHRTGSFGLLAYGAAMLGLTGIAGFLFADAVIFPALPPETVDALTAGPAGLAIFAAVVVYVLGIVLFALALWRGGGVPRVPLALWALGTLPTLAAIALPPIVMSVSETVVGIAMVWIAVALNRGGGRDREA